MKQIRLTINNFTVYIEDLLKWTVKLVFLVFLYYAMFSRDQGLFGLSGGMAAAFMSFSLFIFSIIYSLYFRNQFIISQLVALTILLLGFIAVTPIISTFIFDLNPRVSLRLMFEIAVVGFIFLAVYNMIRSEIITPKYFLYALAIVGVVAGLQTIVNLVGEIAIRRVSSIGGVNYIGNTFAMSAVIWIMIYYRQSLENKINRKFGAMIVLCFTIIFIAMLITGTRSAVIAFMLGLMFLMLFGMKRQDVKKYLIIISVFVFASITILAINFDLTRLFERYTMEQIIRMVNIRLDLYARSVTDLSLVEFLVGRPDLYIFSSGQSGERLVNTHNLFLSLIRYHGIFVLIIFISLLLAITANYLKLYSSRRKDFKSRFTESSIVVLLIMVLVYTMLSGGRPTRAFSFFVILGYLAGYFELIKNVHSNEKYQKMII
ncbi:MAG: hypothetical protein JJU37_17045 [Balneolaceae bacterium]|nr:hypothetical protein [Balneolaceae bacterium]